MFFNGQVHILPVDLPDPCDRYDQVPAGQVAGVHDESLHPPLGIQQCQGNLSNVTIRAEHLMAGLKVEGETRPVVRAELILKHARVPGGR